MSEQDLISQNTTLKSQLLRLQHKSLHAGTNIEAVHDLDLGCMNADDVAEDSAAKASASIWL